MFRIIATALVSATFAVGSVAAIDRFPEASELATVQSVSASDNIPTREPRWMSRPCKTEDSRNCYWNARTRGLGGGHSFYAIRVKGEGVCRVYWQPRYARTHNHCTTD